MSVKELTYYTVVCDQCGKDGNANGEITAWSDREGAVLTANDWDDWYDAGGDKHYCGDCWEWRTNEQ
jgi:hypothetical protein